MKVQGRQVTAPSTRTIAIPRDDGPIVFKAAPVLDFKIFEALCPPPKAPWIQKPGEAQVRNPEDPTYKEAVSNWARQKTAWMFIQSLNATEGIEWETVKADSPDTWLGYTNELQASGLTQGEIAAIMNAIIEVCGLNQQKIDEATKSFLAGQDEVKQNASSQNIERIDTPSGEPPSDSE